MNPRTTTTQDEHIILIHYATLPYWCCEDLITVSLALEAEQQVMGVGGPVLAADEVPRVEASNRRTPDMAPRWTQPDKVGSNIYCGFPT